MSRKSVIQKLTVELVYSDKEIAEAENDVLVDQMRRIILEELNKIFTRLSLPNEVISIDKLVIDLGEFKPGNFFDDLVRKTEEELDQVMTRLVYEVREAPDGQAQVHFSVPGGGIMTVEAALTQRDRSSLEKFFYFLYYGILPWSSIDTEGGTTVIQLADDALQFQAETFANALRQSSTRESLFERMAGQLTEAQVAKTMALLSRGAESQTQEWLKAASVFLIAAGDAGLVFPSGWSKAYLKQKIYAGFLRVMAAKDQSWTHENVMQLIPELVAGSMSATQERQWFDSLAAWIQVEQMENRLQAQHSELKQAYSELQRAAASPEAAIRAQARKTFFEKTKFLVRLQSYLLRIHHRAAGLSSSIAVSRIDNTPVELLSPKEQMEFADSVVSLASGISLTYRNLPSFVRSSVAAVVQINPSAMLSRASVEGEAERREQEAREHFLNDFTEQQRQEKIRHFAEEKEKQEKEAIARREAEETLRREQEEQRKNSSAEEVVPDDDIYIANAGLVVLWPFLNVFFTRLGLVENREFLSADARAKAVHVLQYVLTGELREWEEHELMLNKLLCGMPVSETLPRSIELTEEEKAEAENLLLLVISRWDKMTRSSVKSLRETFLMREGKLRQDMQDWRLQVQRKGMIDILVEKLPWGIGMIKMPWNSFFIYTSW